jgi:hypothetical protein
MEPSIQAVRLDNGKSLSPENVQFELQRHLFLDIPEPPCFQTNK